MSELFQTINKQQDTFEKELCELLRIPSISADPAHQADVMQAARWVQDKLAKLGLKTDLLEGDGNPLVYAETAPVPGAPVALVYGHYDVQPADPLDEWTTPPFEPDRRDGNVYARGATDDKGQMLTHVFAVESWLKTTGSLPLQVKFLIEGEEEVGSGHLSRRLQDYADRLNCDCIIISDTAQFGQGLPAITYGLRGIAYFQLKVRGPKQDLHSGVYGGSITNPLIALNRLLASMIDDEGRIQVPGFYDDVAPLTDREREQFGGLPFDARQLQEQLGVDDLHGEKAYSTLERRWARPAFDVHGMWGGYQGEGEKTVLPAYAGAKFSFRLVPDQVPEKIVAATVEHLEQNLLPGVTMELKPSHASPGFMVPLESDYITAATAAIEEGFGRPPVFIREGGSIPIVTELARELDADVLLLGWGRNDDCPHGPNEKFSLADFQRGIRSSAALWRHLGRIDPQAES